MYSLPAFFKGLTPELIKKAEIELKETPCVREQALTEFKNLILEQDNISLSDFAPSIRRNERQKNIHSRLDDLFLLRFLRMKKFDVHKAFKVWKNYYTHKKKHAGKITCLKPSEVKKAIEMNIAFLSPYKLSNGTQVIILRIGAINISEITAEEAIAALYICGELSLECEATQICGTHMVVDFTNATYQHYKQFITFSFVKFTLDSLQESWPSRPKGVHFVREPYALHAMMKVIKRLGKKKTVDRMHCHGNDLNSLHKHIPKEFLPEDLGGTLPAKEYKDFSSYVLSQEHVIEKMNEYGMVNF